MAEKETQYQLVTFQIGEELYGIDIMDVKEIVRVQDIRPIPNAPSYVEGIFNLRGDIIPIINLHRRFHLKKAQIGDDDELLSGFIIIDINGMKLGVIIDKVARVVSVEAAQVQPPPQILTGIGAEYIQGVVHQENGYLIILDIRKLFNPKELQKIGELRR
jgi:purine-binding chemotaxis protein CheW